MKPKIKIKLGSFGCYNPHSYNLTIDRFRHSFNTIYISCGVLSVTNLPDNQKMTRWLSKYSEEELADALKEAFTIACNTGGHSRKSHLIFTDTEHGGKKFGKLLDKICQTSSPYQKNVNTGNNIKVWIFTNK